MGSTTLRRFLVAAAAATLLPASAPLVAADYEIDPTHSFVQFRIDHIGTSWLYGSFDRISGRFSHDPAQPSRNRIEVSIDPASIDSNHAERDKRLRSHEFLDVARFPAASFTSTRWEGTDARARLHGDLTVHGVTRPIVIEVEKVGEGPDPWGGYRVGYLGRYTLTRRDFGIDFELGPAAEKMEITLSIEGKRR